MNTLNRTSNLSLLTLLVLFLTTFQGLIPTMPITNPKTIAIVSAIVMFLVTGLTALKQYLSADISNKAMYSMLIAFIIGLLGGANDLFNVIHFSDTANQWIRFTITALILFFNIISKALFPSDSAVRDSMAVSDHKPLENY